MSLKILPLQIRNDTHARYLLTSLGVSGEGIKILSSKNLYLAFTIEGIRSWEANIIKQSLLSLGADAALQRDALLKNIRTTILISGTVSQLRMLCAKLKNQPFALKLISEKLSSFIENILCEKTVFNARDKVLTITKPIICGILNITSDSFSGDGLLGVPGVSASQLKAIVLKKVEEMVKYDAKMLDIGAESSRPFSKPINDREEIRRLLPILRVVRKEFKNLIISIDTYKYVTAKAVVDEGADMINDITAFRHAPEISHLAKRFGIGCVIMHMKGKPRTMQLKPHYQNVTREVSTFFEERLKVVKSAGVSSDQVLIDPGIGFGKRVEDNLTLINDLYKFKIFGRPIFVGVSRKSFIGTLLKVEAQDRLIGSVSANLTAIARGANIVRVHDVKETWQALQISNSILTN